MDILDRAKKVLAQSRGLETKQKEQEAPKKLAIPKNQFQRKPIEVKKEPTELALILKDDENIFLNFKKCIDLILGDLETSFTEDKNYYGFGYKGECCPLSIDPTSGDLKFYSSNQNLYFDLMEIIKFKFGSQYIKQIKDFVWFVFNESSKGEIKLPPVSLGKHNEFFKKFYLYPGKTTGLKSYFDKGSKNRKNFFGKILERVFKTLSTKSKENKNKEKIKYFLNEMNICSSCPDLLTLKENELVKNEINLFLEKYKESFGTYKEYKARKEAKEKRKSKIGF